ncbi:ankyrin repeat domain-containing protein [Mucilaginibacter panaciglaebae]
MNIGSGKKATTTQVWLMLQAAYYGDLEKVQALASECEGLLYAQYNYAPPIHFAVREGHIELVKYLLSRGAHDSAYRFYPFLDSMQTVALDRGYKEIAALLDDYAGKDCARYKGDNGKITYNRTSQQKEFEKAVSRNQLRKVKNILEQHPEFALDDTYFWSEGILTAPVKEGGYAMADMLISYGAKVPKILKWAQFYYFETLAHAEFIMARGMDANTISWQHVTLLHDMAQKGYLDKAALLLGYGAAINALDEAYLSTPLGLAARWGHLPMVELLLTHGADPKLAGADWATPLAWAESKGHKHIAELLKRV